MSSSSSSHTPPIPVSASKLVHNLKEIVKNHSDEEIYVALKETNMDPDEAVHKLMHQDTFHEVKRKRDRKKENGRSNDPVEVNGRVSISRTQNTFSHAPPNLIDDIADNKQNVRDDRNHQTYRAVNIKQRSHIQAKSGIPRVRISNNAQFGSAGRNGRPNAIQVLRKSWTRVSGPSTSEESKLHGASENATSSSSDPVSSKQKVSSSEKRRGDQEHQHEHELSQELGTVANFPVKSNRFIRRPVLGGKAPIRNGSDRIHSSRLNVEHNAIQLGGKHPLNNNYHRNRASYQSRQQTGGFNRAPPGLEWKPKPGVPKQATSKVAVEVGSENVIERSPQVMHVSVGNESPNKVSPAMLASLGDEAIIADRSPKPESLNLEDDRPVIIPEHLQVAEADSAGLSFGSFDVDFEIQFTTQVSLDDSKPVDSLELLTEPPTEYDVTEESPKVETVGQTEASPPMTSEVFVMSNDEVLSIAPGSEQLSDISKPEPSMHQGRPLSYIQTIPNYQGFGLMAQPQYQYDSGESQPQEISRLPNFVQPFGDPASNYFSPVFRPGSDADMRYQILSTANNASKFSSSGQTLPSSQEASQNTGSSHTTVPMGQPPLPVHAYAAQPTGVAISPYGANVYGYQYMPPNYAYMHPPYQSSYSGNSAYPQPPIGSNFASGARGYPPVGTTALKYPPQYKVGTTNTPHALVATGYGGFATAPSGFAGVNPAVTAGSGASSYDDMVGGPQYKDNSLYTSSHQMEGSAIWVQAPLSRDPSGIQANSYYNLHSQGQHAGYSHSQATHAHPAAGFASYAQSASGPNNQLLQQPHGSVGFGTHSVILPPPQRGGQVNWTNNYAVRNQ